MKETFIFLVFSIFASYEGFLEGYLDLTNNEYPLFGEWWRKHKHKVYIVIRCSLAIGLSIINAWMFIPMVLSYSFWHNGTMYYFKDKMRNNHTYGGFAGHHDGVALFDFAWYPRLIMFVLSIISLILIIIK